MAIGIGHHCWFCDHGPCTHECDGFVEDQKKKSKESSDKFKKEMEEAMEATRRKITAHIGPIGAGKDYHCNKLVQEGFIRMDFKTELQETLWRLFGWRPKDVEEYEKFKLMVFRTEGIPGFPRLEGRHFAQRMGTEVMRHEDLDWWAKKYFNKVMEDKYIHDFCTGDLRFKNEFELLYDLANQEGRELKIVFCNYRSPRYRLMPEHASEALACWLVDHGFEDGQILTWDDVKYYEGK